jgi:hypothetical protein
VAKGRDGDEGANILDDRRTDKKRVQFAATISLEIHGVGENKMARRRFLAQLFSLPFLGLASQSEQPRKKSLKIMMKSAWGSDDPTRAAFPFLHGLALADAGHDVQIFLLGEATYLMRKPAASAIVPVGWPPLAETLEKIVAKHIPIFA